MTEVTKEEFYEFVYGYPLDLVHSLHGEYPYDVEWRTRSGRHLKAKSEGSYPEGKRWPEQRRYFIIE